MKDGSQDSVGLGRPLIAALLLTGVMLAALIAILLPDEPDTLTRARNGGVVRVGYALEPPFTLLLPDGRLSGEAPEVLRSVLATRGIKRIDWLVSDFGKLLHELESGRIDIIASGMFITPERSRVALFSQPTALVRIGLLLPGTLASPPESIAELASRPKLRLAVLGGAIEGQLAETAGISPDRIIAYPDSGSAIAAILDHRADALALPAISLHFMRQHGGLKDFLIVDNALPNVPPGMPAFVFRKNDARLQRLVDQGLADYLGSPAHLALVSEFGISQADLPHRTVLPP